MDAEQLIAKADNGDIQAQLEVGSNYYHGRNGFAHSDRVARDYWLMAAEAGNTVAQRFLGGWYRDKLADDLTWRSGEKDKEKAYMWFTLAGDTNSANRLGLTDAEKQEAQKWAQGDKAYQAAQLHQRNAEVAQANAMIARGMPNDPDNGSREDAENIAVYTSEGSHGFAQNLAASATWIQKAGSLGSSGGQLLAGDYFEHGVGVEQNKVFAAAWYLLAKANGGVNDSDGKPIDIDAKIKGLGLTPAQMAEATQDAVNHAKAHPKTLPAEALAKLEATLPHGGHGGAAPDASAAGGTTPAAGGGAAAATGKHKHHRHLEPLHYPPIDPKVQTALEVLGFETGGKNHAAFAQDPNAPMDGKLGEKTNQAIHDFQAAHPDAPSSSPAELYNAIIAAAAAKTAGSPAAAPVAPAAASDPVAGAPAAAAPTDLKTQLAPSLARVATVSADAESVVQLMAEEGKLRAALKTAGLTDDRITAITQSFTRDSQGHLTSDYIRGIEKALGATQDGVLSQRMVALLEDPAAAAIIAKAITAGSITAVAATAPTGAPATPPASAAAPTTGR